MLLALITFVSLLPCFLAGPDDTLDQLRVALSNVALADQVVGADVITEWGEAPPWISGSLIRHACGVFGEPGSDADMLNYVSHLFDCIPMGQSYSFYEGKVTFSSQFYDTNIVEIWKKYQEDMSQSSVYWGCIYAQENSTAKDRESDEMYAPGRPSNIPAVAWWQIGKDVLAMSEWPAGVKIDIHNVNFLADYDYNDGDWSNGFGTIQSPAHEQYGNDGRVWSSAGTYQQEGEIFKIKRIVFYVDPDTHNRVVVGEFDYADVDLSKCTGMGEAYPNPDARIRNVHSIQITENFIVIPEGSYIHDPCTWVFNNESLTGWNEDFHFESSVNSRILVMDIKSGEFVATVEIPPMMTTHMLGAYEDAESGLLHLDLLKFQDSSPYTKWTFVDDMLSGEQLPDDAMQVTRYTLNMSPWSLYDTKNLVKAEIDNAFEFSNINPEYQGKPYKYAYMIKNAYHLHGSLVKLNVEDGSIIEKEFPNGLFPTEPIFLPSPNPIAEDDGVVLMSGIDGEQSKGFLMVFDATNLEMIYYATAPKLTLFGVHSKFYPFDVGCEFEDCTP